MIFKLLLVCLVNAISHCAVPFIVLIICHGSGHLPARNWLLLGLERSILNKFTFVSLLFFLGDNVEVKRFNLHRVDLRSRSKLILFCFLFHDVG